MNKVKTKVVYVGMFTYVSSHIGIYMYVYIHHCTETTRSVTTNTCGAIYTIIYDTIVDYYIIYYYDHIILL